MHFLKKFSFFFIALLIPFSFGQKPLFASQIRIDVINSDEIKINHIRGKFEKLVKNHFALMNRFDSLIIALQEAKFSKDKVKQILEAVLLIASKNRSKISYIIHSMGASEQLLRIGNVKQSELIIACILQNTAENTNLSLKEIKRKFGANVGKIVQELTENKWTDANERKQVQVSIHSIDAATIKLSEMLYHLKSLMNHPPKEWSKERLDNYFIWAKNLCDRLPQSNQALKEAFDQAIEKYWKNH